MKSNAAKFFNGILRIARRNHLIVFQHAAAANIADGRLHRHFAGVEGRSFSAASPAEAVKPAAAALKFVGANSLVPARLTHAVVRLPPTAASFCAQPAWFAGHRISGTDCEGAVRFGDGGRQEPERLLRQLNARTLPTPSEKLASDKWSRLKISIRKPPGQSHFTSIRWIHTVPPSAAA